MFRILKDSTIVINFEKRFKLKNDMCFLLCILQVLYL